MFERRRWHRITALVLSLTMLFTSIPAMAFAESTSEEPDAGQDVPAEEMTLEDTLILEEGLSEDMIIEEESTETSTTFDLGDGRKTVIYHGQQVRYEDEEGNLTDYDPSLVSTETGTSTGGEDLTGYTYENRTGDMKQYIPEKLNEETPLLMENGDYAITMAPYQEKEKKEKVKKEKDEYLTPYEKIEQKAVNAVYEGETVSYEYQSMNQGVKETLVLHEAPENNTFSYLVTAKGMEAELLESGVIVFTDRKTEKETAYIDKPFMNDATGEAYSEEIEVSMKKKATGKYIVTYTLDEEYLNDKERVYPVSVDPTATWKGDDEFKDVYVISGSYVNTNFYDSDIRLMVAGKGIEGTYRTYIKIPDIKGKLAGYFVESAYITVYESGDCEANQTIRFNRINESWTSTSLTWNNKPEHNSTAINSFTTEGKQYASHKVKATNTIRSYIDNTNNSNYGIVMRNVTSSPDFAEFYGSRTSLTSYRPKLVVTYSDKPTAPSSVTVTKEYLKSEETLNVQWAGITSAGLDRVEYRIAKYNDDGTVEDSSYVPWSTLKTTTSSSGSASIDVSSFTNRKQYRIYIRGVDQCDNAGSSKSEIFYTDRSYPTFETAEISPITTSSDRTNNKKPVVRWKIKETYFEAVKIYLGDELRSTVKSKESSYSLTDKDAEKLQHGENEIKLVAVDKAGNTNSKTLLYYVDLEGALITDLYTEPSATSWSSSKNDKTPVVHWDTSATDVAKVQLLLDDVFIYSTSTIDKSISILEKHFTNVDEKIYEFTLKLTDKAGNVTSKTVDYYFDGKNPIIDSFSIVPDSGTLSMTNDTTPTIKWTVTENHLDKVYYSLDGGTYKEAGTSTTGNFSLPAITTDGTHKIKIKAVDKAGNSVVSGELTYYLDTTKPVFSSKSIDPQATSSAPKNNTQPEISWTITETNLDKVYYSIDSTASADYVQMSTAKSGTFTIPAGKLTTTKEYTIRLKAIDKAGNVSAVQTLSYYLDVTKPVVSGVTTDPATSSVSLKKNLTPVISWTSSEAQPAKVEYQIDDKSYKQAGTAASGSFTIPEGEITTSGVHTIRVRMTDKAGNVSSPVGTSYHVDVDAPVFSSLEMTKSSFLFPSANRAPQITWKIEDAAMKNVYYSVNGGESACVNSGAEGSVTLPETVWGDKENGKFVISVYAEDAAGNMCEAKTLTYYLKSVENPEEYVPKNITVTESYGKRVITWKLPAYDGTKASYTLHRGTDVDFVPSNENLVTDDFDVTSLLYIDNEILEAGTYYYKIKVCDLTGDAGAEDYVSEAVTFENTVTIEQFSNRMGFKEYLGYFEFAIPTGTGYVEKSTGNLLFEQTDFSISNAELDYGLERTYNSLSTRTSMIGTGWLDSYHLEIYTFGKNIYFLTSDGSCYLFTPESDGYICHELSEYSLCLTETGYKITTKTDYTYMFNKYGQLESIIEPNGYSINNFYDNIGRLTKVSSSYNSCELKSVVLSYNENNYLLESVVLPDENNIKYQYNESSLSYVSFGNDQIIYNYSYDEQTGLLKGICDGELNLYQIIYNDKMVSKVIYPNNENYIFCYDIANKETTLTKQNEKNQDIYTEYYEFDEAGKKIEEIGADGLSVKYNYSGWKLKTKSRETEYETYEDNIIRKVNDVITETFYYDKNENLETIEDTEGQHTEYKYKDGNPNLIISAETTKDGKTSLQEVFLYDEDGNEVFSRDEMEQINCETEYKDIFEVETVNADIDGFYQYTDFSEDLSELLEIEVVESGHIFIADKISEVKNEDTSTETIKSIEGYSYDVDGNEIYLVEKSSDMICAEAREYDSMGRELKSMDESGIKYFHTYDFMGREIETRKLMPDGTELVTSYQYDKNGSLIKEIDERGVTHSYMYDSLNRKIAETTSGIDFDSVTETITYGYDPEAKIHNGITITTPKICYVETVSFSDGRSDKITYTDICGRQVKVECENQFTDYTYDKSGNQIVSYSGNLESSLHTILVKGFDQSGNCIVTIENPTFLNDQYAGGDDSIVTESIYDALGNQTGQIDGEGHIISYKYDNLSRLTSVDIGEQNSIDLDILYISSLDSDDGLEHIIKTDANYNKSEEIYNAAGMVIEIKDIGTDDGICIDTKYEYDERGNKSKEIFSDGSLIEYLYNERGDVIKKVAKKSNSSLNQVESIIEYDYNNYGDVVNIKKFDGVEQMICSYSYCYDSLGRLVSTTTQYEDLDSETIHYRYNESSDLEKIEYPDNFDVDAICYEYDSFGRIKYIETSSEKKIREYSYDDLGRVSKIKDYLDFEEISWILQSFEYDCFDRLESIQLSSVDNADVLESFTYSYDRNNQIIKSTHINNLLPEGENINETRTYLYDSNGQLIKSSIRNNLTNDDSITLYSYDKVGNRIQMLEDGVETSYLYNGLNQMIQSDSAGITTQYRYDEKGNQVLQNIASQNEIIERIESTYSVTGELLHFEKYVEEKPVLVQHNMYNQDGRRICKVENNDSCYYYYDNDNLSFAKDSDSITDVYIQNNQGDIIKSVSGGNLYSIIKDIQGSTSSLLNQEGELAAAYQYSDFGETEELIESTFENQLCYTGAVFDKATGLYYLNARYYNPVTGRFLSQDTYRGSYTNLKQWHLYAYCANNPINYIDPTGYAATCVGWGVEAAFSGGKKNANGCLGVQFVNLYKGIKKRYKNQSVHVYWSVSGSLDATDGQDFAWDILDNPKSLLKTENLKSVAGYGKSFSLQYFRIYSKKPKEFHYKATYGTGPGASFSLTIKHAKVIMGMGEDYSTIGVGYSTNCVGYEISLGTCRFSKKLTKCAMGIGTYYKRKINERTKKASGRKR